MDNNQVDPETFFLETWDIVQLPAVKKARLNVCESLDSDNAKLRKALIESYTAAKEEDRDTMKKALENLNIDIEKELANNNTDKKVLTAEDIPWDPSEEELLTEEVPADTSDEAEPEEEPSEDDTDTSAETGEDEGLESVEAEIDTVEDDSKQEDVSETETEQIVDVNAKEEIELDTVGDAVELLQEFDDDTRVEFETIRVDGQEYPVDTIDYSIKDEDDKKVLILGVNCDAADKSADAEENIDAIEPDENSVETIEVLDDEDSDAAEDNGDVEVIESLKDMVRQKEALETEVSNLRKAKAVGDAKEQELQEKLTRYRNAFRSTSAEAAKIPELQSKIQELTEKLTQSQTTIKTLTEKVNNARQLKESIENSKASERRLQEEISTLARKSKTLEAKLEGQTKLYTEKLQERTNLAKSYKSRFIETLTKYIESKAHMLGVKPSEITSRLNESYTLADVDAVCDQILDSTVNFSRLPFSSRAKTSARIAESVSKPLRKDPEYGYEIDDSLLELAGLKK